MLWFLEGAEDPPPLPAHSAVFVVRNGRYEPQNLMPILPRMDILEFDGFVTRRGAAAGGVASRPPEMRQASLVKNPVSVRRDSVRAWGDHQGRSVRFSLVLDAQRACTLTVRLLVAELEESGGPGGERRLALVPQGPRCQGEDADQPARPLPSPEQLGAVLDSRSFGAGLGQAYESPPIDLSLHPAEHLAFDHSWPRDIPVAVCLEPEGAAEEACAHYSYLSLQKAAASSPTRGGREGAAEAHWAAQVYTQKLQYGGNCFVLHEVFGAASKRAVDCDAETGSSDCVICLSEPRDTAVLPCRHMCFCSYCAGIVRLQCDRCPVCRQKVKSLLQFRKERDVKTEQLMGLKPQEPGAPPQP